MVALWAILGVWTLMMFRVGMVLHETGSLRAKNAVSAALRNAADICVAVIAFWMVGGAICFCESRGVIGVRSAFIAGHGAGDIGLLLVGMAAVLLSTGIVGGVLAERSTLLPVLASSAVLAGLAAPLAGYWANTGWLGRLGFHDLAGASFLHVAGASFALVGAIVVGPRMGKYNRDGSSTAIPGHSVPLSAIGLLMMLAAAGPYLAIFAAMRGQSMTVVAVNGLLAGAGGALASLVVSHFRYGKPDAQLVFGGMIGGAIAIAAGADVVPGWTALVVGAAAGVLVPIFMLRLDLIWHVDDPTSALSIHGIGGAWGIIATGLFARANGMSARLGMLGVQLLGLVVIAGLAAVLALVLFGILKRCVRIRIREEDEFDGLDLAEHDIAAYPDFQQTMIKSYHLREA